MSIIRVNDVSQFTYTGKIAAAATDLMRRTGSAVRLQFKDVSFFDRHWKITATENWVIRVALGSIVICNLATIFLQVQGNQNRRPDTFKKDVIFAVSFIVLGVLASISKSPFLTVSCAVGSLIQLRTCSLLPRLNEKASSLSLSDRVGAVVYHTLKHIALSAIAVTTFKACNKNLLNGVLFFFFAVGMGEVFSPEMSDYLQNLQLFGWFLAAIFLGMTVCCGIAGSILLRSGTTFIRGIETKNLSDFLRGIRGISFVFGFIFPRIANLYSNALTYHSFDFMQRVTAAVSAARQFSKTLGVTLTPTHFEHSKTLIKLYLQKLSGAAQREAIIQKLKKIPEKEQLLCFLENYPFLDPQEMKEFIQTCGIQSQISQLWKVLDEKQIKQILLSTLPAAWLTREGLEAIQAELNSLEKEINVIASKSSTLDESEIYVQIREGYEKIEEYNVFKSILVEVLAQIPPDISNASGAQNYILSLMNLNPQVKALNQKIQELQTNIESYTGELTLSASEALGEVGLRIEDCKEILADLQLNFLAETPFTVISQMLAERGIKNKYDLIQNKILFPKDNKTEELKIRLLYFILKTSSSAFIIPPSFPWMKKTAEVVAQVHEYASFCFFCALRLYSQPIWSALGIAWGVRTSRAVETIIAIWTRLSELLVNTIAPSSSFSGIAIRTCMRTQLTLFYLSRFGPGFALIYGIALSRIISDNIHRIRSGGSAPPR